MAKTGMTVKSSKQSRLDAELALIIDEMERAMWNAHRPNVAQYGKITMNMENALDSFIAFCRRNPSA